MMKCTSYENIRCRYNRASTFKLPTGKEIIQKIQICDKDAKIISNLKLPYIMSKTKRGNKTHRERD